MCNDELNIDELNVIEKLKIKFNQNNKNIK